MQFFYGIQDKYTDITQIVMARCNQNGLIQIPASDIARAHIFGDKLVNIKKHILIHYEDGSVKIFEDGSIILFIVESKNFQNDDQIITNSINKLDQIQKKLILNYGNFTEEYPEQLISTCYIDPNDRVLELGGNIGRNSLIIATLLKDDKNLVSLECDKNIAKQLEENRNINKLSFHIEKSALSKRKLIQREWVTIPSDIMLEGFNMVDIISFTQLEEKYDIKFDTIVADCEGALYYILMDDPDILNNINKFIVENDYVDMDHKGFVDNLLKEKGLTRIYYMPGGWGPCFDFFYEVWKRL